MPRKAAAATESAEGEEPSAPARRSTRISSKPQSQPEHEAEPRKRKSDAAERDGRKKKVKSPETVDDEGEDDAPKISIDIGDYLPVDMKLKNEQDEDIVLADLGSDIENSKGVVLFCVPKADTSGCTTQACGFRDNYSDFSTTGYQVYCLSADKPAAQEKWKTKKSLPYPLLSDPKRELISALGVGQGGKTQRSHFVFSKEDGKLKLVDKRVPVKPVDSSKLALEFIKGQNPTSDDKEPEDEAAKDEKMAEDS